MRLCLHAIVGVTIIAARTVPSRNVKKHKNGFYFIFANIKDAYLTIIERAPN